MSMRKRLFASFASVAFALALTPSAALAAQGDCGQPVSDGDTPTATDCLFILRAAVGTSTCDPVCICDLDRSTGNPKATDALTCLNASVNFKARLIDAIHSRCSVIDFTLRREEKPEMAMAFFKRVSNILSKEEVSYDKATVVKIIEKFFPDYRRILNELQRHASSGSIDSSVLAQVSDIRNISELVISLKNKDFTAMRKWVVLNSDIDASRIFRKIYDSLYDYLKPEFIPQAVVIIAKYQYQAAFVADQEINLVACLTEMMVDTEFK